VRYPAGKRWVTLAVSQNRRAAVQLGAQAYRHLEDGHGRCANAVRVVSLADLETEGGDEALSRAASDLWARSQG
jgi:hypothetical protein